MSPYHRPPRFNWWLGNRAFTLFVVRELTSVFIAAYVVLVMLLLRNLTLGREAYEAYLRFLGSPGMVVFHLVALAAAVYHSITWFTLSPKAMVVRVGGNRVPPRVIVGANYAAWIVVSAIIAWIVLRV
ncbi:MAG: fumarate reductase subunit C [Armatimonadota bacterium]